MAKPPWDQDRTLVRIVLGNHTPTEFLPEDQRNLPDREPTIICAFCYNDWPCKSYTKAKAAKDAEPPSVHPAAAPSAEGNPDPTNPTIRTRTVKNF